jgi:hypothetical protein
MTGAACREGRFLTSERRKSEEERGKVGEKEGAGDQ